MTQLLREWILGIVAVSLLSSFALSLAGEAPSRRVIRLMSAFALLLAVVLPLKGVDAGAFRASLAAYERAYQRETESVTASSDELLCELTGETLKAYVEKRAEALGVPCEAEVSVVLQDGYARPVACTLVPDAEISRAAADALRGEIAAALDIDEVYVTGR